MFSRPSLAGASAEVSAEAIGGVPYVTFAVGRGGLTGRDAAFLANLSSAYALFQVRDAGMTACSGRSGCGRWTGSTTT